MNGRADEHPDTLLADYSVENLPPGQRAAVERHLATCARCRRRLESLTATAALLRALPPPALPHSFTVPRRARRRQALRWLLPSAFLAAAAVLFLALSLSLAAPRPAGIASTAGPAVQPAAAPAGAAPYAAATTSAAVSSAAAAASTRAASSASGAAVLAAPVRHPSSSAAASTGAGRGPSPPSRAAPGSVAASAAQRSAERKASAAPSSPSARAGAQPYQVLLALGGAACLVVAGVTALRGRRGYS